LAAHYRSIADKALADKDHASAGRWLKAAGDSAGGAAAWTGRSPSGPQAEAGGTRCMHFKRRFVPVPIEAR
jgi:hypothetical protein